MDRSDPDTRIKAKKERRKELRRSRLNSGSSGPQWLREVREVVRATLMRVGKDTRPWFDGILTRYSSFPDVGFPDPSNFDWIPALEAQTATIQKELEGILRNEDKLPELRQLSPDHSRIADSDLWRAFFLMGYGNRAELARSSRS